MRKQRSGNTDYGQGANTGLGTWVEIENSYNADLRAAAAAKLLTGYYRPEDADVDGAALAAGFVRFCANNTGNESNDRNRGETICVDDGSLDEATANAAAPEVQLLVIGTPALTAAYASPPSTTYTRNGPVASSTRLAIASS
jgi:hypothetical protein